MKSLKYVCLSLVALLAVSCSDDDFKPGKPAAGGDTEVYFSVDNESSLIIGMDDDTLQVLVERSGDTEKALEVPVKVMGAEGIFSGASTVKFEAGESEAIYDVVVSDKMKMFENYKVQLLLDEAYSNPYTGDGEKMPVMDLTIRREDYRVVATGVYVDNVLFKAQWEQDLEYSSILNLYRLSDAFAPNTAIYFLFDGESFSLANSKGVAATLVFSGYVDRTFGNIMIKILEDGEMGYTEEVEDAEGAFYFKCSFDVSKGSYGSGEEDYFVTEWFEKPWEVKE